MPTVKQALREKVLPNYGPRDPGDTLDEWRTQVRVIVPGAPTEEIDTAIRDAVRDGLMWWDGACYHRAAGTGPADRVASLLDALDIAADPSHWPTMPREAWEKLGAIQDVAYDLRKALGFLRPRDLQADSLPMLAPPDAEIEDGAPPVPR